ncbi:GspH/FimT family pseudopilin [bacterium]|nr:GspH/FimT family pseudopilin [bacterium]
MRRHGGFTFLEITVVVVILMALAAVAMPRMRGTMQHMRLKQAARDVAAVMRLARDSAVVRGNPVEVIMNMNNKGPDQYQLALLDEKMDRVEAKQRRSWHKGPDKLTSVPGAEALRIRTLPEGTFFAEISSQAPPTEDKHRPRFMFYPDGSASGGSISIQDVRDRTISVEIYKATGLSKVEAGKPPVKLKTRTLFYGPKSRKK